MLYIEEHEGDLGPAQRMGIELTPDSVHKKVLDIPHDELPLSKRYSMGGSDPSRGGCQ
jgi:hypothetical protein